LQVTPVGNAKLLKAPLPLPPISLLLETTGPKAPAFISLPMAPHETISSLKLRVRATAQFTSNHVLVLGDRQLLDHETVGQLAAATGNLDPSSSYLHILVRLKDVEAVTAGTSDARRLTWDSTQALPFDHNQEPEGDGPQPIRRSRSALTAQLADSLSDRDGAGSPLSGTSLVLDGRVAMVRSPSMPGRDSVVHLIIRKPYNLGWRHRPGDGKVELSISAGATAGAVAAELEELDNLPAGRHQLTYNGQPLASHQSLASYGIDTSAMLELVPLDPLTGSFSLPRYSISQGVLPSSSGAVSGNSGSPPLSSPEHALFKGWQAAQAGLASGHAPQLTPASSGGTYFCRGSDGTKVAVLKPADEEPYGVNNPRLGLGCSPDGHGLRKGIRPGEGAAREVAAYLLDHQHYAGVPPTALVTCKASAMPSAAPAALSKALSVTRGFSPSRDEFLPPVHMRTGSGSHSGSSSVSSSGPSFAAAAAAAFGDKVSSLQMFVNADTDCEEQGPATFPVHQVHKIAQLDMRMANTDRNASNILAKRAGDQWTLIPIDHGYCLPSSFQDISFEWMNWPQARVPFSEETRAYIAAVDVEADLAALASHGLQLRWECRRVARATTLVLQEGAARNLTPLAIASIMCRELRTKSPLEKLHARALQLARPHSTLAMTSEAAARDSAETHDATYFRHLRSLLTEYLDEILLDDTHQ